MNGEILRFVDAIHRDKSIDKSVIFQGIEDALESAARKQLDTDEDIDVQIDRETGDISASKNGQPIDPQRLGRIGAQAARDVMIQKIKEAESRSQYEEFKDRVGEIVNGSVSRFSGPNILVTIGNVEAFFPKSQQVPGESYDVGDRVRALVKEVDMKGSKVMVELSRTDPRFIERLFELEVPEIQEGIIEIKEIASEPGNRTKVSVASNDEDVDPVGACVGVRGSRIKGIVAELNDERVDIIPWSANDAQMIENSLKPADVQEVKVFKDRNLARVIVDENELSVAIGRGGQNVRLASKLTGWEIDVMSPEEEEEKLESGDIRDLEPDMTTSSHVPPEPEPPEKEEEGLEEEEEDEDDRGEESEVEDDRDEKPSDEDLEPEGEEGSEETPEEEEEQEEDEESPPRIDLDEIDLEEELQKDTATEGNETETEADAESGEKSTEEEDGEEEDQEVTEVTDDDSVPSETS